MANIQGVHYQSIPGIKPDANRPAEQWFTPISKGDAPRSMPVEGEKVEWKSEGVYRASVALAWLDEWVASRTMIADAIRPVVSSAKMSLNHVPSTSGSFTVTVTPND